MFSTPHTPGNVSSFSQASSIDIKPDLSLLDGSDLSQNTALVQAKLNRRLGPEYLSQRPAPGGGPKLTYVEGWKIVSLANEVFGYNGWSSSVTRVEMDFMDVDPESKRICVGVTAVVKVTLRDGSFHEDVGYGTADNVKSKGAALDKAKKEAVTDATKRALKNFGSLLGLCLYEKSYTQEVVKIKVPPPKFDKEDLHRRPENDMSSATTSMSHSTPVAGPSNASTSYTPNTNANSNSNNVPSRPLIAVLPHMRPPSNTSNYSNSAPTSSGPNTNSNWKGKTPQTPASGSTSGPGRTGLNTPGQTPAGQAQKQIMPPPAPPQGRPSVQAPVNHRPISSHPIPPLPNSNSTHNTTSSGATTDRDRRVSFAPLGPDSPQRSAPSTTSTIASAATVTTSNGHRIASMSRREHELESASEDAFFTSDDDALLAAFDMGEMDAQMQKVNKPASTAANDNATSTSSSSGARTETGSTTSGRTEARSSVSGSSSSGGPSAPSSTPPVGGFRFPKESMNGQSTARPSNPSMNQTRQHGTASSSAAAIKLDHGAAGVKRSADAMSGGSGAPIQNVRRTPMGLAQQGHGQGQANGSSTSGGSSSGRRPLTNIILESRAEYSMGGGDVKRMKR